jgi:hypothetical protein
MENNNIFENTCLIQLKTSCWTGEKQISNGALSQIANVDPEFKLDWRFVMLSVPERASVLPAHLYEAERQKFISLMDEARELAIVSLREEFSGIVSHLVERLSENGDEDKPKIIRNGMFGRFQEFMDNFASRNIFADDELSALVTQARSTITGLNTETVKSNSWLKLTLAEQMSRLKNTIDASIETMPRRFIRYTAENGDHPAPTANAA